MWIGFFVVLFAVYAESLRCRTREHIENHRNLRNIANMCVSTINFTQSFEYEGQPDWWNRRPTNDQFIRNNDERDGRFRGSPQTPSAYYGERDSQGRCLDNGNEYDQPPYRNILASSPKSQIPNTRQKRNSIMLTRLSERNNSENERKPKSPLEPISPCVIHCVFRELRMVNREMKLDKHAMMNGMTRRIRDPELREFIQDSIEECFDIYEHDRGDENQCEFSKKISMCVEEKARRSCEDWNNTDEINFNNIHHHSFDQRGQDKNQINYRNEDNNPRDNNNRNRNAGARN